MGKKSSKTETDTTPWKPMQPFILGAANSIQNTVNGNAGNLNAIAGGIRGQLPQLSSMAFGPNAGLSAASGYAQNVLGGQYLGQGNPYMNQMLAQTRENVGNQVNGTFSMAGRTGGGNHEERLGQGLASAENALRYQDYGAERDRMSQMAGLSPALDAARYNGVQPFLAASQSAAQLPYAGIQALSPLLGQASGAGTTSGTQPGGWGTQLAGAAASALPFLLCEPEAKQDVELLARDWDGLGWYRFAYKTDPDTKVEGPMADEVERLRPWALGPRLSNGWRTVNISKLGVA